LIVVAWVTKSPFSQKKSGKVKKFNIEGSELLELEFKTKIAYRNPFTDIDVSFAFTSLSKKGLPCLLSTATTPPGGRDLHQRRQVNRNTEFTQILKILVSLKMKKFTVEDNTPFV